MENTRGPFTHKSGYGLLETKGHPRFTESKTGAQAEKAEGRAVNASPLQRLPSLESSGCVEIIHTVYTHRAFPLYGERKPCS